MKAHEQHKIFAAAAQAINKLEAAPTAGNFGLFEAGYHIGYETGNNDADDAEREDAKFEGQRETVENQRAFLDQDLLPDPGDPTEEVIIEAVAIGQTAGWADAIKEARRFYQENKQPGGPEPIKECGLVWFLNEIFHAGYTAAEKNNAKPPATYEEGYDHGLLDERRTRRNEALRFFWNTAKEHKNEIDGADAPTEQSHHHEILNAIWSLGHDTGYDEGREAEIQPAAYQIFAAALFILRTHSGDTASRFFEEAAGQINADLMNDDTLTPGGPREAEEIFYEALKETRQI